MQEDHKELVIGGTLQQRISSCLEVLDKLLNQDDPVVASMLVAEKRYGASADNLFGTVLQILGTYFQKINFEILIKPRRYHELEDSKCAHKLPGIRYGFDDGSRNKADIGKRIRNIFNGTGY